MCIRKLSDDSQAVCALLSIWICVIITAAASPRSATETLAAGSHPILLIDPGHGGLDGGALSVTGTPESRINWEIAEKCLSLARFLGVRAELTRPSREIEYPTELKSIAARKKWDTRRRAEMANETPGAILLSIHQNTYPSSSPHGIQVLYAPNAESRELADRLQASFSDSLPTDRRRTAVQAGREIYLLNHVRCPAVLAECGFLSNPDEARRLETADYQKKLAMIMIREFARSRE